MQQGRLESFFGNNGQALVTYGSNVGMGDIMQAMQNSHMMQQNPCMMQQSPCFNLPFTSYGMGNLQGGMMMGQPSMPMPAQQPQTSQGGRKSSKSRSRERVKDLYTSTGRLKFADDNKKISSTYKCLGWAHGIGEKKCTPKRFRSSTATCCDPDDYPMVRTSQLSEEEVDCLVFILTGVAPDTRLTDIGCVTKGDLRDSLRAQYNVKNRKNPTRLQVMGSELDNLVVVAHKMGYPMRLFTSAARSHLCYLSDAGSPSAMPSGSLTLSIEKENLIAPALLTDQDDKGASDETPTKETQLKDGHLVLSTEDEAWLQGQLS